LPGIHGSARSSRFNTTEAALKNWRAKLVAATLCGLAQAAFSLDAAAQAAPRNGKEVVEAVCAGCHAGGDKGAPRIGDKKAWSKRASQGLTSLTQHALTGMRQMPSHGGKLDLTDLEIGRAVAYMVNMSGGKWTEPASAKDMQAERSGPQVVKLQCAKCHTKGEGGAPKIGDRAAWAPRLSNGVETAVRSAIRGHGGMPARGGMADLTDNEIRNAISYMFNPESAAPKSKATPAPAANPRNHKTVGGMDIELGLVTAEALRARQGATDAQSKIYGGIPTGSGYYAVSISLHDSASKAEIKDAKVEARVANLMNGETKTLEVASFGNAVSYGNFFQLPGKDPYTVTLQIRKPGAAAPLEVKFDLKP
jgi:cytochrome c5